MWYIISAAQLEQYLDENRWIYLVDMRDRNSYAQAHIQGAVNIPDEEFWERVGELPADPDYFILLSGTTQYAGGKAVGALRVSGGRYLRRDRGISGKISGAVEKHMENSLTTV